MLSEQRRQVVWQALRQTPAWQRQWQDILRWRERWREEPLSPSDLEARQRLTNCAHCGGDVYLRYQVEMGDATGSVDLVQLCSCYACLGCGRNALMQPGDAASSPDPKDWFAHRTTEEGELIAWYERMSALVGDRVTDLLDRCMNGLGS